VLSFDFEAGSQDNSLDHGLVASCPARDRNKFCAVGELNPLHVETGAIVALDGGNKGLFKYSDSLTLSFDYWIGPDAKQLVVQMFSNSVQQNFGYAISEPVTGAWAHAELRMTDSRTNGEARGIRAGDNFRNILFCMVTDGPSVPIFIDNLRITDYAGASLPTASTWDDRIP
jgi:hypothetical protein